MIARVAICSSCDAYLSAAEKAIARWRRGIVRPAQCCAGARPGARGHDPGPRSPIWREGAASGKARVDIDSPRGSACGRVVLDPRRAFRAAAGRPAKLFGRGSGSRGRACGRGA